MSVQRTSKSIGAIWSIGARQAERLIGIISIAILARTLTPGDFGLLTMAGAAVAIVEVFGAFGFDWALLRINNPTREHYDSAWTLRLITGIIISIGLCGIAPFAADYFQRSELIGIIYVLALNSTLGGIENIGTVDFRREARFDMEFYLRVASKILGFVASTSIALSVHSYWALVLGITASRLATTVGSYVLHPFRPRFSLQQRRSLLAFSVWMLVGNLADTFASRFSGAWIGRHQGSTSAGHYSLASEISLLATTEIAAPVNRAIYPSYTKIAGDVDLLRPAYLRVASIIWAIGLPAALGVMACAREIITVLLGDQWLAATLPLKLLALAGVVQVMAGNTHYVYWSIGMAKFVATLSVTYSLCFLGLIMLLGSSYGVSGVAAAQLLAASCAVILNFHVLSKTIRIKASDLWIIGHRPALSAIAMWALVAKISAPLFLASGFSVVVRLAGMIIFGSFVYVALMLLTWVVEGKPTGVESMALAAGRSMLANRGHGRAI